MNKLSGIVVVSALLVLCASATQAATLHVSTTPGEGEYSRLWDAWDASVSGDTILIHAGDYTSTRKKNFQLHTNWSNNEPARSNMLIKGAGDGRVTLHGQIKVAATPEGTTSITFEDLYIDTSYPGGKYNRSAFYLDANPGTTLGSITIRNVVAYNTGSYNDKGLFYVYGEGLHEQHLVEKCTYINLGEGYQTGHGIYDKVSGPWMPDTLPVLRNLIIWSNDVGLRSETRKNDVKIIYSDVGDSLSYNFWNDNLGVGTIENVDPMFVSLDPADPYFLYLAGSTPDSVKFGAHDGTYMGALPVWEPPIVDAGADVVTWLQEGLRTGSLDATVTDDGAPSPYTVQWTVVSEPSEGAAVIETAEAEDTSIILAAVGEYVLQLDAFDGEYTTSDTVTINVYNDSCEATQSVPGYQPLVGDLNGDCRVDDIDMALLQENWLKDDLLTEDWLLLE